MHAEKQVSLTWLADAEEHDFPAAESYLSLIYSSKRAAELTAKQLQLLHELIANAAAFGVVADTFQVSSCPIGSPIRNPVCRPAESDGDSD